MTGEQMFEMVLQAIAETNQTISRMRRNAERLRQRLIHLERRLYREN